MERLGGHAAEHAAQRPPAEIHTLRKEFGRLLTEGYGIYAASTALRHSSVQVTAAFYAEDTRRIVPSLLGRKVTAGNLPTSQLTPTGGIVAA